MKILLDPRLQNDAVPAGTNTTSPHVHPLRARGDRRSVGEHRDPERSLSFWAAGLQGGLKVPGGRVADGRAVTQAFRSSHRARRARAGGSPGGPRICGKLSEPWLRLKVAGRISRQRASRPVPGSSGAGHRRLLWDCDSPRRHLPPARGWCLVQSPRRDLAGPSGGRARRSVCRHLPCTAHLPVTETGSFPAPRWPASASVGLLFSGCPASQPPGTQETQGLALDSPLASGSAGLAWSPSRPPGLSPREQRVCLLCSQPCAPWRSTFQLLRELPLCTHSSAKRLGQRPSVRPVSALDVLSSLSSVVSKAIT